MRLSDYHCHTLFSGDVDPKRGTTIDGMCRKAIELGLYSLAVTDHLEINMECNRLFPPLDGKNIKKEIDQAKASYKNKLKVIHGVELAQPLHMLEKTEQILTGYEYDFIIGSVHCIKYYPDFYDFNFKTSTDSTVLKMWNLYLEEMTDMIKWGNIDSLAHITYPYRYFKFAGREKLLNMEQKGRDYFENIFKLIIEKGIALEVNTSGIRQGMGDTLPHRDLIEFYYRLGGRVITVGSDAHYTQFLGGNIKLTYETLKSIGFKYIAEFNNRKLIQRSFE